MPTTYYTPAQDFRDDGNTWYGRWSLNRNNACNGNGFGIGYDKGYYADPVHENCPNGARIVSITSLANMQDPAAPPPE
jgi:hypothetical protein